VQQTVDDVVIIAAGRMVRQSSLEELEGTASVLVRTPTPDALAAALAAERIEVTRTPHEGELHAGVRDPAVVGGIAFRAGVELHELTPRRSDLEEIFLSLTAAPPPAGPPTGPPAGPPGAVPVAGPSALPSGAVTGDQSTGDQSTGDQS